MIRVNLLPIKQARRRSAGKAQLWMFAAVVLIELLVIGLLWFIAESDLEREQQRVAEYKAQVAEAKKAVADAKELEAQKEQLQKQLSVLSRLEAQRSGPVRVLDELQAIMSPPRNEEDRFAQLQKNWNVDWDPRRLWIETLSETNGDFKLAGSAVNADDVAEFLQRLTTATHFYDVELEVVQARRSRDAAPTVDFNLRGKISYEGRPASGKDGEGS